MKKEEIGADRYPTYLEALDQIDQLKRQLAEKDKEIESLHETISNKVTSAYGADLMAKSIQFFLEKENHELKQHQTQLAISELEKVKEKIDCEMAIREYDISEQTADVCVSIAEQIDQQIKGLKREKDVKD